MDLRTQEVYTLGFLDGTADVSANPSTYLLTDPTSFDGFIAELHFEHPTHYLHVPYVYDMFEMGAKTTDTVTIEVTFTEDVTGVDITDFALVGSGSGSPVSVTGSGNTYLVTILYDDESGPVALILVDDDSIVGDLTGEPLGGVGPGNGNYGGDPLPFFTKGTTGLPLSSPLGLALLVAILMVAGLLRRRGSNTVVE